MRESRFTGLEVLVLSAVAAFSGRDLQVAINVWLTLREHNLGMSRLYEAMGGYRVAPVKVYRRKRSKEELAQRKAQRQARLAKTKWGWQEDV